MTEEEMTDPAREWRSGVEAILERECVTDLSALEYLTQVVASMKNRSVRWSLDYIDTRHVLTLHTPYGRQASESPSIALAVRSVLFGFFTSRGIFDYEPNEESVAA